MIKNYGAEAMEKSAAAIRKRKETLRKRREIEELAQARINNLAAMVSNNIVFIKYINDFKRAIKHQQELWTLFMKGEKNLCRVCVVAIPPRDGLQTFGPLYGVNATNCENDTNDAIERELRWLGVAQLREEGAPCYPDENMEYIWLAKVCCPILLSTGLESARKMLEEF